MSHIKRNERSTDLSVVLATRTAIDSSGCLGSLYDGYRDEVLGTLNISQPIDLYQLRQIRRCVIAHGCKNTSENNILKLIDIDSESRLSVLLNMRSKHGITAVADYSSPVNEYTRLLRYTCVTRTQELSRNVKDVQEMIKSPTPQTTATHFISGVHYGIDVVIVLQLPYDNEIKREIDRVLCRICTSLNNDDNDFRWIFNEESLIRKIVDTKVYSNTTDLNSSRSLLNIYQNIQKNKISALNNPVSYYLRPIKWLYPQYKEKGGIFTPLSEEINDTIEQYVFEIHADISRIETSLNEEIAGLLCGHLRGRTADLQKRVLNIKQTYANMVPLLAKLLIQVRGGRILTSAVNERLKDDAHTQMKTRCRALNHELVDLKEKGHLITDLGRRGFRYVNVVDSNVSQTDDERTIEEKLIGNDQTVRILCSTDSLNKRNLEESNKLRRYLVEECKNNPNLHLIYADFSYCSYGLHCIARLPLNKYDHANKKLTKKETLPFGKIKSSIPSHIEEKTPTSMKTKAQTIILPSSRIQTSTLVPERSQSTKPHTDIVPRTTTQTRTTSPPKLPTAILSAINKNPTIPQSTKLETNAKSLKKTPVIIPSTKQEQVTRVTSTKSKSVYPSSIEAHTSLTPPSSLPNGETINILLLGETGVGKSTFINAFANYLRFNTLDQAQSGQPIVLIPVSFLITTGHNFVERNITFGDVDQSNNEDFDHPGHSVTQHCRSYLFQHLDHTHIRLIDTPGFGDTRGVDQDDHNMQHIIEYVRSLSHINAVCFLLKPNESRLNIFFRSCLTQLFSLLGSEIGDNVVFCFTNCRSTFYTPGNTAPLLKKMLTSLSMDRVTLRKENTFCFDSESFRYLVASQHKIEFTDDEKKEYGRSWVTSATEANRLVHYISKQVGIYSLKKECQSIEDAKLEIILMIRPILETVRNTFRNIILCRMSACKTIVLQPTALHRPATICLSCDVSPHLVGGFWIVRDLPHEIYEKCVTCSCALKQHIPMTYKLAHKVNDGMDSQHENDIFNEISLLLNVCVDFACFLTHVTHLLRDDPFESALKRMIADEESNICRNKRPNQTNSELIKELKKFQSRYEQRMKEMKSKEEHHELSVIYDCIKTMHKYPVVREQMASIKEQRSIIKKHNESEVQENGSGARL